MSRSLVMAIDQGTTGTTVLLINSQGAVESRGYAELPQHFPRPGRVEHDGEEIWISVLKAARLALNDRPALSKRLAAVGITNQRETIILWDQRTGRPVGPALVWQDRRTAERCAQLRAAGHERLVRRSTGLVLDPYFSATKLEWMFRQQKPWFRAAARGDLLAGTIDTWLLWKLTGGAVHATDPTNASRTMLYDIHRLAWSPKLLDLFDVPAACLPEVRPSSGNFGTTSGAAPIPDGITIGGIAGDQQAALFGQGCVKPGQVKNTYGTGAFLLEHLGSQPRESKHGLLTTVACGSRGEPAWAFEGSVFIAGAAVQWLRDGLGIIQKSADIEALAATVPDTGGVTVVPAFTGLGAPWWRADSRGAIFGLTRGTTRAHLARAILESIAQQSADVFQVMQQETGRSITALRVDGGATANNLLMQFQADLLGIPIQRPKMIETTALGAALLAGMATGVWASPKEAEEARVIDRTFRPGRNPAWRRQQREEWGRAVQRLLASVIVILALTFNSKSPARAATPPDSTTVILLGTGTPRPNPERSGPATAITVGHRLFLFDAGPSVMRQLVAAKLPINGAEAVFLTHLHTDHTLGYPDLIFTTWVMGRRTSLPVYGPPGLQAMTDHLLAAWQEDIEIRTHGLERESPGGYRVDVHELQLPASTDSTASAASRVLVVYDSAGVKVTAIPVSHGNWEHAYGFRIDTPDRSIVLSGDTAFSPLLMEMSRGVDLLIHEVYPKVRLKPEPRPGGELWVQYMKEFHTSDVEVGRLAATARPKLLLLHHVVWMGGVEEELVQGVREGGYDGAVTVGADLGRY